MALLPSRRSADSAKMQSCSTCSGKHVPRVLFRRTLRSSLKPARKNENCSNTKINFTCIRALPSVRITKLEDMKDLPIKYKKKIDTAKMKWSGSGSKRRYKLKIISPNEANARALGIQGELHGSTSNHNEADHSTDPIAETCGQVSIKRKTSLLRKMKSNIIDDTDANLNGEALLPVVLQIPETNVKNLAKHEVGIAEVEKTSNDNLHLRSRVLAAKRRSLTNTLSSSVTLERTAVLENSLDTERITAKGIHQVDPNPESSSMTSLHMNTFMQKILVLNLTKLKDLQSDNPVIHDTNKIKSGDCCLSMEDLEIMDEPLPESNEILQSYDDVSSTVPNKFQEPFSINIEATESENVEIRRSPRKATMPSQNEIENCDGKNELTIHDVSVHTSSEMTCYKSGDDSLGTKTLEITNEPLPESNDILQSYNDVTSTVENKLQEPFSIHIDAVKSENLESNRSPRKSAIPNQNERENCNDENEQNCHDLSVHTSSEMTHFITKDLGIKDEPWRISNYILEACNNVSSTVVTPFDGDNIFKTSNNINENNESTALSPIENTKEIGTSDLNDGKSESEGRNHQNLQDNVELEPQEDEKPAVNDINMEEPIESAKITCQTIATCYEVVPVKYENCEKQVITLEDVQSSTTCTVAEKETKDFLENSKEIGTSDLNDGKSESEGRNHQNLQDNIELEPQEDEKPAANDINMEKPIESAKITCQTIATCYEVVPVKYENCEKQVITLEDVQSSTTGTVAEKETKDFPKALETSRERKQLVFICRYCPQKFGSLRHVRKHTKKNHKTCTKCNLIFNAVDSLKKHERKHREKLKTIKCNYCHLAFSSLRTFKKHLIEAHKTCAKCKIVFETVRSLKAHEQTHMVKPSKPMMLLCLYCPEKFSTVEDLRNHSNNVHKKCVTCKRVFETITILKNHAKSHETCDDSEISKNGKMLENKVHVYRKELSIAEKNIKRSREDIVIAAKRKQPAKAKMIIGKPYVRSVENVYPCTKCNKLFLEKQRLADHQATVHFICTICGRSFGSESNLHQHKLEHEIGMKPKGPNRKQLPESHSATTSKRKTDWQSALRARFSTLRARLLGSKISSINTGRGMVSKQQVAAEVRSSQPIACRICDRNFGSSDELEAHMVGHQPGNHCRLCRLQSEEIFEAHIDSHMYKKLISGEPILCDECNVVFPTRQQYKQHRRSNINVTCNYVLQNRQADDTLHCKPCNVSFRYIQTCRHRAFYLLKVLIQCAWCSETFNSLFDLNVHKFKCESRESVCGSCGVDFLAEEILQSHITYYHNTKPKTCTFCNVKFESLENHRIHEKSHAVQRELTIDKSTTKRTTRMNNAVTDDISQNQMHLRKIEDAIQHSICRPPHNMDQDVIPLVNLDVCEETDSGNIVSKLFDKYVTNNNKLGLEEIRPCDETAGNGRAAMKEKADVVKTGTSSASEKEIYSDILKLTRGPIKPVDEGTYILLEGQSQLMKETNDQLLDTNNFEDEQRTAIKLEVEVDSKNTMEASEADDISENGKKLSVKAKGSLEEEFEKVNACKRCSKSFKTPLALKDHRIFLHDETLGKSQLDELKNKQSKSRRSQSGRNKHVSSSSRKPIVRKMLRKHNPLKKLKELPRTLNHKTLKFPYASKKCRLCNRVFVSVQAAAQHEYEYHYCESRIHKCDNCGKILTSINIVNGHVCTDVKIWRCKRCNLKFRTAVELNLHNKIFHLEIPGNYRCNNCEQLFLTNCMLFGHKRRCHKCPKCKFCEKTYATQELMDQHKCSRYRFRCKECPSRFQWEHSLKLHVSYIHKTSSDSTVEDRLRIRLETSAIADKEDTRKLENSKIVMQKAESCMDLQLYESTLDSVIFEKNNNISKISPETKDQVESDQLIPDAHINNMEEFDESLEMESSESAIKSNACCPGNLTEFNDNSSNDEGSLDKSSFSDMSTASTILVEVETVNISEQAKDVQSEQRFIASVFANESGGHSLDLGFTETKDSTQLATACSSITPQYRKICTSCKILTCPYCNKRLPTQRLYNDHFKDHVDTII